LQHFTEDYNILDSPAIHNMPRQESELLSRNCTVNTPYYLEMLCVKATKRCPISSLFCHIQHKSKKSDSCIHRCRKTSGFL